jgi:hypothetical protein
MDLPSSGRRSFLGAGPSRFALGRAAYGNLLFAGLMDGERLALDAK